MLGELNKLQRENVSEFSFPKIIWFFNLPEFTAYAIKAIESEIRKYSTEDENPKAKSVEASSHSELDNAPYIWVRQFQDKNIFLVGDIVSAKVVEFNSRIYPDSEK